jgi:hypothetical protein
MSNTFRTLINYYYTSTNSVTGYLNLSPPQSSPHPILFAPAKTTLRDLLVRPKQHRTLGEEEKKKVPVNTNSNPSPHCLNWRPERAVPPVHHLSDSLAKTRP